MKEKLINSDEDFFVRYFRNVGIIIFLEKIENTLRAVHHNYTANEIKKIKEEFIKIKESARRTREKLK